MRETPDENRDFKIHTEYPDACVDVGRPLLPKERAWIARHIADELGVWINVGVDEEGSIQFGYHHDVHPDYGVNWMIMYGATGRTEREFTDDAGSKVYAALRTLLERLVPEDVSLPAYVPLDIASMEQDRIAHAPKPEDVARKVRKIVSMVLPSISPPPEPPPWETSDYASRHWESNFRTLKTSVQPHRDFMSEQLQQYVRDNEEEARRMREMKNEPVTLSELNVRTPRGMLLVNGIPCLISKETLKNIPCIVATFVLPDPPHTIAVKIPVLGVEQVISSTLPPALQDIELRVFADGTMRIAHKNGQPCIQLTHGERMKLSQRRERNA